MQKVRSIYREEGRRYLYKAVIARNSYVGRESRRFVDQLFGGRLSPLVARLAEEDALDDDDIAAIEAILKELKHDRLAVEHAGCDVGADPGRAYPSRAGEEALSDRVSFMGFG